jgi:hypothetical protein
VLVPFGAWLALKLIPPAVMADSRARAQEALASGRPVSRAAAIVIVLVWIGLAALGIAVAVKVFR